jgi:hypothetical protein
VKTYLDRGPLQGEDFYFIEKPVWFSVHVDVPDELVAAAAKVANRFAIMHEYLRQTYEAARVGLPVPEQSELVKEVIASCHAPVPVEVEPAKKQKQKATAAVSSYPLPTA